MIDDRLFETASKEIIHDAYDDLQQVSLLKECVDMNNLVDAVQEEVITTVIEEVMDLG